MKSISIRLPAAALALVLLAAAAERQLTNAEWVKLKQGEILKEVKNEGGTQSGAWSAGLWKYSPEVVWKAVSALESYDEYMNRVTVSVLLDEAAKDRVVKSGLTDADQVEKLFAGMKPHWRRDLGGGKYLIYSYQRNQLPWPVNDRWILLEMIHDPATMTQSWKRLVGNIKQDHGSWKISAAPGGGSLGVLNIHLDLDIPATGPFTAFAMGVTLPDTYKGLDVMAADIASGKLRGEGNR
jgi:hypothetical protein